MREYPLFPALDCLLQRQAQQALPSLQDDEILIWRTMLLLSQIVSYIALTGYIIIRLHSAEFSAIIRAAMCRS